MSNDRPLAPLAGSGSVRTRTARMLARPANVHHALAPAIDQPALPSTVAGTARQDTDATSEPMLGSVTEMPTMSSPPAMRGSHAFFCASVPPAMSALARISGRVISEPAAASDARD